EQAYHRDPDCDLRRRADDEADRGAEPGPARGADGASAAELSDHGTDEGADQHADDAEEEADHRADRGAGYSAVRGAVTARAERAGQEIDDERPEREHAQRNQRPLADIGEILYPRAEQQPAEEQHRTRQRGQYEPEQADRDER